MQTHIKGLNQPVDKFTSVISVEGCRTLKIRKNIVQRLGNVYAILRWQYPEPDILCEVVLHHKDYCLLRLALILVPLLGLDFETVRLHAIIDGALNQSIKTNS